MSEVGTDTVPVSLVELQSVGARKRSPLPLFLVGIAAVAIVAFALGASLGATPAPSPTAAAIGDPGGTPGVPLPSPSVRPGYTMHLPTEVPITPTPTDPPNPYPWTWTRFQLDDTPRTSVDGVWGLRDGVLLRSRTSRDFEDGYDWQISTATADGVRQTYAVPPAIDDLTGGSVIDGRLWLVARVEGVTASQTTWQLVSTETGETWSSLGVANGLGPVGSASFLGRRGGTWVADVSGYEGSASRLLWSTDGQEWRAAEVPALSGLVEYWTAASIGNRMLILGRAIRSMEDVETFVLTSTDGRTWKRAPFELPQGRSAIELACSQARCVVPVQPLDGDGTEREILVSSDGLQWAAIMLDLPVLDSSSTLRLLRPTGTGFVAMAGFSAFALLSADGRDWVPVQVMPADRVEWISDLAVAGDLVLGYAEAQDSTFAPSFWTGSLEAMRKG